MTTLVEWLAGAEEQGVSCPSCRRTIIAAETVVGMFAGSGGPCPYCGAVPPREAVRSPDRFELGADGWPRVVR